MPGVFLGGVGVRCFHTSQMNASILLSLLSLERVSGWAAQRHRSFCMSSDRGVLLCPFVLLCPTQEKWRLVLEDRISGDILKCGYNPKLPACRREIDYRVYMYTACLSALSFPFGAMH